VISLQQRSYHQGWSIHLFGTDKGKWLCVIEAPELPVGLGRQAHAMGATIQEAVENAWGRVKAQEELDIHAVGNSLVPSKRDA
jgi:hypothetical protein